MEIIWHYTTIEKLESIMKDELLKVSEVERKFGLKPAVWFSKNDFWEPTATKMLSDGRCLSIDEQYELLGMIRIAIEFNKQLVSWGKYRYESKINPSFHKTMEESGIEKGGNPKDWFCSFNNIQIEKFLDIEQYDGRKWVSIVEAD